MSKHTNSMTTRRDFLKTVGVAGGAALVAGRVGGARSAAAKAPAVRQSQPFAGKTVKVGLIGGANYDELYKIIPAWEAQTGAKVEVVFNSNHFENDKRLMTDFATGTVNYDLISDHTSFASAYIKAGGLAPLDEYFAPEELTDFIPSILEGCRRDGQLWQIPRHFDISALHYRTDLMGDATPPETWDQFKQQALELTDKGKGLYGTQFAGKEEALVGRFYEVLLANGGALFDAAWEPTFNSPVGVKSIAMFAELYQAGAMPPGMTNFLWEDVAKTWASGVIGMYTEWYGWYAFFQDPANSQVAGKFGLARQPKGDGGIHSGWAGAHSFSITAKSANKEAAASLIKHLSSVEGNRAEAKLGIAVARQSVLDESIAAASASAVPLDKQRAELLLLQAKEDFVTPPLIAEWSQFATTFFPILQRIILGDVEPQAGLDEAAEKTRQMMAAAGYYG